MFINICEYIKHQWVKNAYKCSPMKRPILLYYLNIFVVPVNKFLEVKSILMDLSHVNYSSKTSTFVEKKE